MAKVTIVIEDVDRGVSVVTDFEVSSDKKVTPAQSLALEIVEALTGIAHETHVEQRGDDQYSPGVN